LRPDHLLSDRPALAAVTTLLCDADGNLFPSEEPAFDASVGVTNRFLAGIGSDRRYTVDRLRRESLGRNFRSLAASLASDHGVPVSPEDLQAWVDEENAVVTRHLAAVLLPDAAATAALRELAGDYRLAVVSSSALARLDACFSATGLDELFPADRRFSAQDSLPVPTSKPDPAVYLHALRRLDLRAEEAVAVEDAVAGVASAVGAGIATIGNVVHVPAAERAAREEELRAAGATAVVGDWRGLVDLLSPQLDRSAR
jgi:HAD superfamily hydrolase (TIGR01509 family)